MKAYGVSLLIFFGVPGLFGQQATNTDAGPTTDDAEVVNAPPVENIDLSKGKQISGIPLSGVLGYPGHGSSDGTVFIDIYDDSKQSPDYVAGDLYAISSDGKVTKIQRGFPEQMKQIEVRSVYPGENRIASLLVAFPRPKSSDEGRPNPSTSSLSPTAREPLTS